MTQGPRPARPDAFAPSLLRLLRIALIVSGCALAAWACSDDASGDGSGGNNASTNSGTSGTNSGTSGTNANTANNGAVVTCTADTDCGAGEVCDTANQVCQPGCASDADCSSAQRCGDGGFCVARGTCSTGDDCADGEVCNTCSGGRCEASPNPAGRFCQTDQNCAVGEFCDTCRATCRPLGSDCDPCQEDIECDGSGSVCLDFSSGGRFCAIGCGSVSDCPLGFACEPAPGAAGNVCLPISGDCTSPGECAEDEDCPAGERCGPTLACVDGCTEGTCPNGEVCDTGICKPPCTSDAECPEGAECQSDGLCKVPGGCLTSRDCPEAGTYCDLDALMCAPGCGDDSDCAGLQVCRNNTCGPRPCDGNYLCAFGQVCDIPSGRCVEPEGPYCDTCDAEAENQCGGEPNLCLRLQDDEGNPRGDFCGVNCDPEDLDACPVGYSCQEIQDENGQVVNNVCFRACDRDPV